MCLKTPTLQLQYQTAPDREIQQALIGISAKHGLTQVHNQPTWQDNILDLVFTNSPSLVKSSYSIPGISDHAMVVTDCDIKLIYNKQNPRTVYLFSKANWEEIYSACERLSLKIQDIINMKDTIGHIWPTFKSEIQSAMDTLIPSKTFKKNNTVPWFNRKLKKMCRRKARLYNHAKKSKQWMEFKQYQKLCKKEFKQAEIDYINKTIQDGFENYNYKPFWRYIKAKKQDYIGEAPLKRKGNLFSESKEKAQILVEQFYSVFSKKENRTLPNLPKCNKFDLPSLNITTPGIEKLLKKINNSKSVGPDNISNAILKNVLHN